MQFVKNGPDIPERLLQAHEDGQVVFFCGAGISYPAGLPTFRGLVKQLYEAMGIDPDPVEAGAIKAKQYDTAVGLLEKRVQDGRQTVREAVARILTPKNLEARNATATHEALLTLAKGRKDRTRLVTTNFDRLFEEVIERKQLKVEPFRAPLLPVPKKRWDGLVYLHGLLTENPSESDLDRLVLSSGDFGLAYLTERWAARFVSELFRSFIVCFVGYSISDPVLRYMMDALAADRLLGESPRDVFAFGSFSKGKAEAAEKEWGAKKVTPILYREHRHHAYLHRTIRAWSETYRDGAQGKERIVVESAMARPLASTEQDDFVGRMIWALSDPSGIPARRFAELDPVPSIEWLEQLSEERLRHADLARFGITPDAAVDENLKFSLTRRPSPYGLAPRMALVGSGDESGRWDKVMVQIAGWLTRHLNDPAVVLWLAKGGGVLHEGLVRLVEWKLEDLDKLEQNNDQAALQRILANAPKAIPGSNMRTLWQLLLKGRVRAWVDDFGLHRWCEQFRHDGLTVTLRFGLRELLAPRVVLNEPFAWPIEDGDEEADGPEHMRRLVQAEVILSTRNVRQQFQELVGDEGWAESLPELLNEFTGLLRDALDLMRELGQADDRSDRSYASQPSISKHPQNRGVLDWTALIELTRDAWLAASARSPELARTVAEAWWQIPYPVFRRMAFFAAAQGEIVPRHQAIDWLLSDGCWWLWSLETLREAMRLLVSLGHRMDETELDVVEKAILKGPPRAMYGGDMGQDLWAEIQEHDAWLRLAKLADGGAKLSAAGAARMAELSERHPDWQLAENEREEFPVWMGEVSEGRRFVGTPREPQELIESLKVDADNDRWPVDDWREALLAWSEEKLIKRFWSEMAPVLAQMPDETLQAFSYEISSRLRAFAKRFGEQEPTFLVLCDRLFDLVYEDKDDGNDPVGSALNHPVGQATEALLNWGYWRCFQDGQGLDEDLKPRLSRLCDTRIGKFRHGRVVLAMHVIALFRVDREWAMRYLLPLFEWERSQTEAIAAWEGFLWSPRLYRPLIEAFKPAFLDTANHYAELRRHGVLYASLLTFAALEPGDVFTRAEVARATASLSQKGLDNAAEALVRALEGAGQQRVEYWRNRIQPYLKHVWPKTQDTASDSIAESFGRLCVASGDAFPEALGEVRRWLQGVAYSDRVVDRLHEAELDERFPGAALELLDRIIGKEHWPPEKLEECLRAIRAKRPELEADSRFQRLVEQLRIHRRSLD